MKAVWKFPVYPEDYFDVNMPLGAEVLSVQMQGDTPVMWARVETETSFALRRFAVRGTGHELYGDEGRFIGTWQMPDHGLVFHLFEVIR